jgi:hypothetical protein
MIDHTHHSAMRRLLDYRVADVSTSMTNMRLLTLEKAALASRKPKTRFKPARFNNATRVANRVATIFQAKDAIEKLLNA